MIDRGLGGAGRGGALLGMMVIGQLMEGVFMEPSAPVGGASAGRGGDCALSGGKYFTGKC